MWNKTVRKHWAQASDALRMLLPSSSCNKRTPVSKKKKKKWRKERLGFSNSAASGFSAKERSYTHSAEFLLVVHLILQKHFFFLKFPFYLECESCFCQTYHMTLFLLNIAVWQYISYFQILLDWSCEALSSISKIFKNCLDVA